jgi:hypothetical protein
VCEWSVWGADAPGCMLLSCNGRKVMGPVLGPTLCLFGVEVAAVYGVILWPLRQLLRGVEGVWSDQCAVCDFDCV